MVLAALARQTGVEPRPRYLAPRAGDIRHSKAATARALLALRYRAHVSLAEGLPLTVAWYRGHFPCPS